VTGSSDDLMVLVFDKRGHLFKSGNIFKLKYFIILKFGRSQYSDGLQAGWPGFDSQYGKIFLFSVSRLTLGPTQHLIQWVPGVTQPGCEADHSPLSSAEVKNGGAILHSTLCLHGIVFN
jgi:hypothetical protein